MFETISVQELREKLPQIIKKLEKGGSYTLIYRSRPVGQLLPFAKAGTKRTRAVAQLASPAPFLLFKSRKSSVTLIRDER